MRKFVSLLAASTVALTALPAAAMELTADNNMYSSSMMRGSIMRTGRRGIKHEVRMRRKDQTTKCAKMLGMEKLLCLNPKLKRAKGMQNAMTKSAMMWYKLDGKGVLWMKDGDLWKQDAKMMWMDMDGRWIKKMDGKLVWSPDDGKTWTEVPGWTWVGSDGVWYKFDASWLLWWSQDMGKTWDKASSQSWPGK
ncbi:MAG: Uncharacterized protein G01um101425_662 [Candidatus Peregrinibacteria bacterium Gr01-1014_25]|nr:MAG: Uncharacterized protein G01um101425_662 [Candidatus Peregrinibacteria bacterium Gr01-1014_25]